MKKLPKIIPANKDLRINFYIVLAFYILMLILLEPMIDYLLLFDVNKTNIELVTRLNEKKYFLMHIVYGLLRLLPMMVLAWFGYRILSSAQLPPARMELPFAVPEKKGRSAKLIGFSIISLALLFLAQNIVYMTQQISS